MNERILELAKRAGLKFPSETDLSPAEKKFAELIVNNCATIADFAHNGGAIISPGEMVKEFFGVE